MFHSPKLIQKCCGFQLNLIGNEPHWLGRTRSNVNPDIYENFSNKILLLKTKHFVSNYQFYSSIKLFIRSRGVLPTMSNNCLCIERKFSLSFIKQATNNVRANTKRATALPNDIFRNKEAMPS
jgi:hypothetical protein